MSRDTTFVVGTIVRAEYLNSDQEVDTGLTWGFALGQDGTSGLNTLIGGTDNAATLIIGGKRAWKTTPGTSVTPSGAAGTKSLWAITWGPPTPENPTGTGILPDFELVALEPSEIPEAPYYRKVGTTEWNGVSNRQVRLTNGVKATAFQHNSFVFRTVTDYVDANHALTLSGYTTQDDPNAHLFTVGVDDGVGGTDNRFWISSTGVTAYTPDDITNIVLRTNLRDGLIVSTDPDRFALRGTGLMEWSTGAALADTFLERSDVGTLKISGTTGADGTLDLTNVLNSTVIGDGWVNFESDINMYPGQVLRYDGEPFGSEHLADSANVAHLGDDPDGNPETFTGDKTFDGDNVFNGEVVFTNENTSIEISDGKRSKIATRAFTTFMM